MYELHRYSSFHNGMHQQFEEKTYHITRYYEGKNESKTRTHSR